ncbi:MAG TPA: FAD-binding oxidoreductase [Verrucomicrobiae bacterium]|nr:FAD-binding oxidoreductase [Verrucomicrobiae bacterium]
MENFGSWGRYPKAVQTALRIPSRSGALPQPAAPAPLLPYGLGRSYGDCCLNDRGCILPTRELDHLISFDRESGVLRCEAGVSLDEILKIIVPAGWFLPVVPGTKFVTVGGAIANDIHGKNHHRAGTFGCHVTQLELQRSDGTRLVCSPEKNPDYFKATIAGLGLTGLITWAEFRLKKIAGPFIDAETVPFSSLEEFFKISEESDKAFEHTVAWIDTLGTGGRFGRGVFFRGNWAPDAGSSGAGKRRLKLAMPFDAPGFLLNRWTVGVFNELYFRKQALGPRRSRMHYDPFFFPLDGISDWNRLYGKSGFFQHQCVIPEGSVPEKTVAGLLKIIAASGLGSFLAVLKKFGDARSPGLMSFPRKGLTLSVDIKNGGPRSFALMDKLDAVVKEANGAVYPAKDARMSAALFESSFPGLPQFRKLKDERFSSQFWRRCAETS